MKWFTFILVCGGLLMGMGMFNTSIGVADDTAQDSEQLTEQMEEGYNLDSLVADDEEKYTREDEWDERYQSDEPYQDDPPPLDEEQTEEDVESTENTSGLPQG